MNRAQALDFAVFPVAFDPEPEDLTYEQYLEAEADREIDIRRGR